ncbi:MAG: preprotein translocase subunit SecA, partial [Candidatus Omnitrophica bacterium]|nr:preprotein translocase subunit SecA [Candidatus Omnitrophota bacterium]
MVRLAKIVNAVNALEPRVSVLSDAQLMHKTQELKEYISRKSKEYDAGIKELEDALLAAAIPEEKERIKDKLKETRNKIFEEALPEAFAVVREAAKRTVNMRHFDVQIAGGIVLHEGKISEMATGEGKTLVATLPAYLNALLGQGVHIVTVNDYLARRDREWMGPIYEFLGLTVGVIQHDMSDEERKIAYGCDITYGTNNEFGFDYLRDNMKYNIGELVQRPFYYAIVDEVDSILIDEARTPLIISGPAEESTEKYYIIDKIVPRLKGRIILEKDEIDAKYKGVDLSKGYDYIVDEKAHTAHLTEEGETKVCGILNIDNLHEMETMEWRHHIIQALRAHNLYKRDVDYVVKDGQVIIVDEFTGRMMPGRRWSDGLHQAVEAKEGMKIERENQTLATITFQNYFRMYEKLAGMTGTALTEANEFKSIYQLDVVTMPTNRPLIRTNYPDCVYKTEKEKFDAVVNEIAELHKIGKPVLVGTISIDKSEHLSELLKRRGVPHQVLNAKYHEMEAQIVAQAGRYKGVTIATNMAGRGTDILLGGNPDFMAKNLAKQKLKPEDLNYIDEYKKILDQYRKETDAEHRKVVEVGGLHVLGTERHEARRIDNQLRGRCGRQGDPGSSRFYVSLGDDLMRLFGSDRLVGMMNTLGLEEGQVIEHPWVSKSIEIAQRRVEQHNFEVRKQLLDYDNVMNKQREVIYSQRHSILEGVVLKEEILDIINKIVDDILAIYVHDG